MKFVYILQKQIHHVNTYCNVFFKKKVNEIYNNLVGRIELSIWLYCQFCKRNKTQHLHQYVINPILVLILNWKIVKNIKTIDWLFFKNTELALEHKFECFPFSFVTFKKKLCHWCVHSQCIKGQHEHYSFLWNHATTCQWWSLLPWSSSTSTIWHDNHLVKLDITNLPLHQRISKGCHWAIHGKQHLFSTLVASSKVFFLAASTFIAGVDIATSSIFIIGVATSAFIIGIIDYSTFAPFIATYSFALFGVSYEQYQNNQNVHNF